MHDLLVYLQTKPDVANAIATIASAVIALAALVISTASIFIGVTALKHQRRHDVLSVKPLPALLTADHEHCISVSLRNNGSGPLLIRRIGIDDAGSSRAFLRASLPSLPDGLQFRNYAGEVRDHSLAPGDEMNLLDLSGDETDTKFATFRDECRAALGRLVVQVDYTDIYGTTHVQYKEALSWYARARAGAPATP